MAVIKDFEKPLQLETASNEDGEEQEEFFRLYLSEDEEEQEQEEPCECDLRVISAAIKAALENNSHSKRGKLPPKLRFKRNFNQEVKKMVVKYEYPEPA